MNRFCCGFLVFQYKKEKNSKEIKFKIIGNKEKKIVLKVISEVCISLSNKKQSNEKVSDENPADEKELRKAFA